MTFHTITIALMLVACSEKDPPGGSTGDDPPTDGGSADGGATDGGATDGGATDGGATDGGATDGGATDGGATDGGATDGGSGGGDGGGGDGGGGDGFRAPDLPCDSTDADCDGSSATEDCDDLDATTYPGALELMTDGRDNDCDGVVDEQPADCDLAVPGGFATLQEALDASSAGDVICLDAGTYTADTTDAALWWSAWDISSHPVHLLGLDGPEATVLDAEGFGRVVRVRSDASGTIVQGVTLTNGVVTDGGGGFSVESGAAVVADAIVVGNTCDSELFGVGGGIYADDADLTVMATDVSDNSATSSIADDAWHGRGGGIMAEGTGTLSMHKVRVENNVASLQGGGVYAYVDEIRMDRVHLIDNATTDTASSGGGAYLLGEVWLDNIFAAGNRLAGPLPETSDACGRGGGMYLSGPVMATRLLLAGNNRPDEGEDGICGSGGGLVVRSSTDDLLMSNVMLLGNQSVGPEGAGGGGLYVYIGSALMWNGALVGNTAQAGAAAWVGNGSRLQLIDSIVVANTASSGGALGVDEPASDVFVHNTTFYDNSPALADDLALEDLDSAEISTDDPMLLSLDGDSPTAWDIRLDEASPALDAGDTDWLDHDGSAPDLGPYGGPLGGGWDLDWDGAPAWPGPGACDADACAAGWDCDDLDADLNPDAGC